MADSTTADITINATPAEVMAVIADLPAYPEWSDGVKSVEVLTTFADGRPETARLTVDAGVIKDTYDLAYAWDGDHTCAWKLTQGSVIKTNDGTYTLDEVGGNTKVTYNLKVDVSIPMLGMMKRKAEKTIVDTALKGLKKRVEQG
ncbi:MAG: SRPBCC family protein [Candidatus Nanopelagicales bacterium]